MEHNLVNAFKSQNGVATRRQLLSAGISASKIKRLVISGQIERKAKGVYVWAGSTDGWLQNATIAVFSCGPKARLSHESVLQLYDIIDFSKDNWIRKNRAFYTRDLIHVVNPRIDYRDKKVYFHRSKILLPCDAGNLKSGIPHVSIERSIIDCSQQLSDNELSYVLDRVLHKNLSSTERFIYALQKLHSGPGREKRRIKSHVEDLRNSKSKTPVESFLEKRTENVISKLTSHDLVRQFQVKIGSSNFRLDFAIPELKIAIEADGYQFHGHRAAFDSDRIRLAKLTSAGWRVLTITAKMTDEEIHNLFISLLRSAG